MFPHYYTLKLILVVYLLSEYTNGAVKVYEVCGILKGYYAPAAPIRSSSVVGGKDKGWKVLKKRVEGRSMSVDSQ